MSKITIPISLLILIISISACRGETLLQPTLDPGQLETQIAEQVSAQLTQIAIDQPTATLPIVPPTEVPLPSNTALPPIEPTATLESASPTPVPPLPTNTLPAPTATYKPLPTATTPTFACQLTKQTPENGTTFKPGVDFDVVWTVKNVGADTWIESEFDLRFDSGDKLHQNELYDLPEDVKPGKSIDLVVDMKAPDKEDRYQTTWVLHRGQAFSCKLTLEINVQK